MHIRTDYANVYQKHDSTTPIIRVLKVFKKKQDFEQEKRAFENLLNNNDDPPRHIIGYLGSYEQSACHCIVLEFADLGSLDKYFQSIPPPTSGEDIVAFFASLFKLLEGLISIHDVSEILAGQDRTNAVLGLKLTQIRWHQDIKPSNILALSQPNCSPYNCLLKLSDFVTSQFKEKGLHGVVPRAESLSFARTYGKSTPIVTKDHFTYTRPSSTRVLQKRDLFFTKAQY